MPVRHNAVHVNAVIADLITDYADCFIDFYSGTQPSTGGGTAAGTLLGTATESGDGTTGLNFITGDNDGEMKKDTSETWTVNWVASGTATWCRIRSATGTQVTDCACGLSGSGASCIMSTTTATSGGTATIQSCVYRQPMA